MNSARVTERGMALWARLPLPLRIAIGNFLFHRRAIISRLFPDRMRVVRVKWGIPRGMKMELNLRWERHFLLGVYEGKVQAALKKFLRPGTTVYNLGAHIGFFTLGVYKLVQPGGQVLAFEPSPRVRERLARNLSLNGLEKEVRVESYALSDADGIADFTEGPGYTQGRFIDLPGGRCGSIIPVDCRRLDTYVDGGGPPPHFVLMDVEHAEDRVIRGMAGILEEFHPPIILEIHGPEKKQQVRAELSAHQYMLTELSSLWDHPSRNGTEYGHYLAAPGKLWKEMKA
jgi:FkbM family methyltransferase